MAGSAVNQDGRSSGLTAPNGPAQQEVIRQALESAGLLPSDMAGVEMHGTGTGLGDPIEVGALAAVFGAAAAAGRRPSEALPGRQRQPLQLSAGKSWIGHSEAAAGVTGLIHAVTALRAARAQEVLHLAATNPYLDASLTAAPSSSGAAGGFGGWSLPRQGLGLPLAAAERGLVLGVSSFAFQGTNAHALLQAPAPTKQLKGDPAPEDRLSQPVWQRTHTWAAPVAHLLVCGSDPSGAGAGRVAVQCRLAGPAVAFLRDNVILGAAWLPTSAVLEIASEAVAVSTVWGVWTVSAGSAAGGAASLFAGVVLPSGLMLEDDDAGGGTEVTCSLNTATGLVEVQVLLVQPAHDGAQQQQHQQQHRHSLLFATLVRAGGDAAGCAAGPPAAPALPAARVELLSTLLSAGGTNANVGGGYDALGVQRPGAAFAAVDGRVVPAPGGLLVHPCLMEAALQLEGVMEGAAAAAEAAPDAPGGAQAAAGPTIKVPASMAACALPGGAGSSGAGALGRAGPGATAVRRPAAGGRCLMSARLLPSAAPGGGCHVADAEFRPLLGPGAGAGSPAATDEQPGGGAAVAASDARGIAPWTTDLEKWEIASIVAEAVEAILGQPVASNEPLLVAGLDSLGAVELRNSLKERLGGLQLPPTILYDHQTVDAIATFISEDLAVPPGGPPGSGGGAGGPSSRSGSRGGTPGSSSQALPSGLMKLLRGMPAPRPLFLAAPGVANAQSAYFAFAQFLSWSDQPIYVLEKDNDLDISTLARQNAADILKVQPEGPYLIGGHSYGGSVAVEVALVLEGWGHDVGLVLIMDTPRPEQIRTLQPDCREATDDDCLELMEMILGALGRDAVGLGAGMAHPRESDEWRTMTMRQRYEFFAPIWRVMRDDNVSVDDVAQQVAYVALAVKQGSQVSDMRHHRFSGRLRRAQVVYFRANDAGACDYFNDSRYWRFSHGTTWSELCDDLTVVDVPGDHFSLLRQDPPDMEPLVGMLKMKLGAFGWAEAVRRERKAARAAAEDAGDGMAAELSEYLEKMGVSNAAIRQRIAAALPVADLEQIAASGAPGAALRPAQLLRALNDWKTPPPSPARATPASAAGKAEPAPALPPPLVQPHPLIIVPDLDPTLAELAAALQLLPRPAYVLELPARHHLSRLRTVQALAGVLARAVRDAAPRGPYVIAGVGAGGVVAHELAVQLQRAGEQIPVLLLIEDGALREAADITDQPWFRLHHLLAAWRHDVDLDAFAARARLLGAQPAGYERQLDAVAALVPPGMERADWSDLVEDRLQRAARSGPQWEEVLSSWVALYAFIVRCQRYYRRQQQQQAAAAARAGQASGPASPARSASGGVASPAKRGAPRSSSSSGGGAGGRKAAEAPSPPTARAAAAATAAALPGSGASQATPDGPPPAPGALSASSDWSPSDWDASAVPSLDAFLLDLFALESDPEAQLDYVAAFRPPNVPAGDWDRGVSQVLTRVSYLRAISARHAPDGALPWTSHVICHGASHRTVCDIIVDGGAAGALRPVAPLLVPLRMARWSDTAPSARDLEAAVRAAEAEAARAAEAAARLLAAPPPLPDGVKELSELGLAPGGNWRPPLAATPALSAAAPAAGATGATAEGAGAAAGGQVSPQGLPATPAPGDLLFSRPAALNAFCFAAEVQPGASAVARARARLALPGSDVTPQEDAAQRDALRRAMAAQRRLATRLPLWVVHGEAGRCGGGLRAVAEELGMPAFALELGQDALGDGSDTDGGGGASSGGAEPASIQELALRHMETVLSLQPHGPHVLLGCGPFSCVLASAIACELERRGDPGAGAGVALVLADGAPALPAAPRLPPPQAYGLFSLLADAGARITAAAAAAGGRPTARGEWHSFVAEFEAALADARAEDRRGGAARGGAEPAAARALRRLAAARRPAAAGGWEERVEEVVRACCLAERLVADYTPEYVFQGLAVLLVSDDDEEGRALLDVARDSCCRALSLAPPGGLRHGEGLASGEGRAAVAAALTEALTELLTLV